MKTLGSFGYGGEPHPALRGATGGKHAGLRGQVRDSRPVASGLVLGSRRFDDDSAPNRRRRPSAFEPDARNSRYATAATSYAADAEPGLIDWDEVVDVVCTGPGVGGLAAALAASISGLKVLVADAKVPGDADADTLAGRLGVTDAETVAYFDSLTQDIGPLSRTDQTAQLPVRFIDGPLGRAVGRGTIATFVGSALRDWSAHCLASSHGLLNTHVVYPGKTVTYGTAGGTVEAAVVGTINVDPGQSAVSLDDWLVSLAHDRGIAVRTSSSLQRLVFDAGQVVGAIIDTPAGSRAVRSRHGVVVETGAAAWDPISAVVAANAASAQVALVTRAASRFARLELLVDTRRQ